LVNEAAITAMPVFTQVIVAKITSTNTAAIMGSSPNANIGRYTTTWFMSGGTLLAGTTADTTGWHIFIGVFNGASSVFRVDGTEAAGNAGANTMQQVRLFSGDNASFTKGSIREAALYNRALTGPERTALHAHLAAKYGL
jgi:hypothetical protein